MLTAEIIESRDIRDDDKIIVVIGPTGSGKSNFIDKLSQRTSWANHSLAPDSHGVRAVRIQLHDEKIVLVDSPGYDWQHYTSVLGVDVVKWLRKTTHREGMLNGILLLHKIPDNRMTVFRGLNAFHAFFGDKFREKVVLATTMWDIVSGGEGVRKEQELSRVFLQPLRLGAHQKRFLNTQDSALEVLAPLLSDLNQGLRGTQEEVDTDGWGKWYGINIEPPKQDIQLEGVGESESDDRKEEEFEVKEEAEVTKSEDQKAADEKRQDECKANTAGQDSKEVEKPKEPEVDVTESGNQKAVDEKWQEDCEGDKGDPLDSKELEEPKEVEEVQEAKEDAGVRELEDPRAEDEEWQGECETKVGDQLNSKELEEVQEAKGDADVTELEDKNVEDKKWQGECEANTGDRDSLQVEEPKKVEEFEAAKDAADITKSEDQNTKDESLQDECEANSGDRGSEELLEEPKEVQVVVDENGERVDQEDSENEKSCWGIPLEDGPNIVVPKQKGSRSFCCGCMIM